VTASESGGTQVNARLGGIAGGFRHDRQLRAVGFESRLEQSRHLLQVRLNRRRRKRIRQHDLMRTLTFVSDHQERGTELVCDLLIHRPHFVAPNRSHGQKVGAVVTLHDFLRFPRLVLLVENRCRIDGRADRQPAQGLARALEGPVIGGQSLFLVCQETAIVERAQLMPEFAAFRRHLDGQFQIPLCLRSIL
jgi:hypothetical protein